MLPLTRAELEKVAVIGRLASIVNLGDGGSSDVWAPDVVTVLDGITAALPGVDVVHDDGADVARAAATARDADVALVVVGYTHVDEGEYIGDAGVDLRSLMPETDDPDLVAMFDAETETRRAVETPEHVRARRDEGGFSRGGDRTSLRLSDDQVALIHAVAAANPRTIVAIVAGSAVLISEWDTEVPAIVQSWYAGMEGGHALADVLFGAGRRRGPSAVLGTRDGGPPSGVRSRRRSVRLRPLARLVEARARRQRGGVPVRVRPELHDLHARPRRRRRRAATTSRSGRPSATPATAPAATSCRCTRPTPRGSSDSRASRSRPARRMPSRSSSRSIASPCVTSRGTRWSCGPGATRCASRDRLPTTASRSRWTSAQLLDRGHHVRSEQPHVAL